MKSIGSKGLLLSAGLLLLSTPAFAQPGFSHRERGGDPALMRTMLLQERLKLSDSQANQVYELLSETKKSQPCQEAKTFTEKRDCHQATRAKVREEVAKLLTPEQKTDFEEMEKRRHDRKSEFTKRLHGRLGYKDEE